MLKTKTRIVYKLVRVAGDKLVSAYASAQSYMLTYEIGKRTTPKIGKIFAFGNLFEGLQTAKLCKFSLRLFRCDAQISAEKTFGFTVAYEQDAFIKAAWNNPAYFVHSPQVSGGSANTVFCDWIEPIEIIQVNNES